MGSMFDEVVTLPTVLFMSCIFVVVWVLRRVTELLWPAVGRTTPVTTAQNYWEKLVLPISPVLVGMLLAFFLPNHQYPYALSDTPSRLLFGVGAGLFTGWAYTIGKALVERQFKVTLPEPLS